MNRIALSAALLASALALTACSTDPPAEAGQASLQVNSVSGTITTYVGANLDKSFAAAKKAVETMQFKTLSDAKDTLTGNVKARTADNKDIGIELKRTSDTITELKVNAGTLNTDLARAVAVKIQELAK